MVYVQVVVIAVYSFFITSLLANQYTQRKDEEDSVNFEYIPVLIILQFIFYMGWLKVAETMINPFGSDDDDFEVNYLIDRNLQMSYLIVDEMHYEHPELLKDQYWEEVVPKELPDRVREKRNISQVGKSDIFDVDQDSQKNMPQDSKKATNVLIDVNDEVDDESKILISSKDSLKPRASVIDKTYQRHTKEQESENSLERQIQNLDMESIDETSKSSLSMLHKK